MNISFKLSVAPTRSRSREIPLFPSDPWNNAWKRARTSFSTCSSKPNPGKKEAKTCYHRGQGVKDNSVSRLINTARPAYSLMQLFWVFYPWPPGSFDLSIPQKTCFLEVLGTCVLYEVKPWTWMSKVSLILLLIGISFSIEFQVDFTTLKRWRNFSVVL